MVPSRRLGGAQLQKPMKTSSPSPDSATQRLEMARRLAEALDQAESALEYRLLMQELLRMLGAPS